jgi:selenoprotein N
MFGSVARNKMLWVVGICLLGCGYGICCSPGPTRMPETGLEVKAFWEPFAESKYKLAKSWEELRNLKPATTTKVYRAEEFKVFLPKEPVAVGDVWKLDGEGLLPFLRQFHKGATMRLHHAPVGIPGAFACLRAQNDRFGEIVFRIHAEFVLSDGRSYYTPAQFAGHLLYDRATRQVRYFRCFVPPRNTNVDVNRFMPAKTVGGKEQPSMLIADIGYAPRMELVGGDAAIVQEFTGKHAITAPEADQKLARRFYKFRDIRWLPWDEAVVEAVRTGKPLHVVVLFGALDDESC